jgi:integrase
MRQYARHLKERVDRGELAGSTANTYWNYIAAFLGWCVYEELVAENPARTRRAEEELPDKRPRSDRQQFWSRADREALLAHLNERAHTAVDERGFDAIKELRDRALASLLAYSGVRGGEVLRDPNDERRSGLRWRDVDLEAGTLVVLGKNQADEEAPLPPQVRDPLERLYQALQPASGEWPVFPTLHRPTLSRTVRTRLANTGYDTTEIEAAIDEHDWLVLYRIHEFVPPALTTNGGRTVMRRVCKDAGIDLDGEHDYLTPHGGRRGAGDVLYREDPVLAQTALRHRSIETTKDSYSYIEAAETASRAGDIFDLDRSSK